MKIMRKRHYVYDLPKIKKVGATSNPVHRIEDIQGFMPYTDFIIGEFISAVEADKFEKQEQLTRYNYQDKDFYPDMLNKITLRHTGKATVTLTNVPYHEVDKYLEGRTIVIEGPGSPTMTFKGSEDIKWLMNHKEPNGFGAGCFWRIKKIENLMFPRLKKEIDDAKAAKATSPNETHAADAPQYPEQYSFDAIRQWAKDKKLYGHPNSSIQGQALKLGEEFGETQKAVLKGNTSEIVDGIGDCVVVLTSLAELAGVSIEDCIQMAWTEIRTRKGTPTDKGDFIKD